MIIHIFQILVGLIAVVTAVVVLWGVGFFAEEYLGIALPAPHDLARSKVERTVAGLIWVLLSTMVVGFLSCLGAVILQQFHGNG